VTWLSLFPRRGRVRCEIADPHLTVGIRAQVDVDLAFDDQTWCAASSAWLV